MKRSKMVAFSAVSAALCSVLLTVGAYFGFLDVSCYMFASVVLMIPLAFGSLLGAFLAYLAGGLLALLFSGANYFSILPYAVFFGLHPIVNAICVKFHVNKFLAYGVKALWFDGAVYLMYKVFQVFTVEIAFIQKNIP